MSGGPGMGSCGARIFLGRLEHDALAPEGGNGFGLIECIVTIAIMGTALVFLVGTMFTTTRVSGYVALRSQSETEARRAAELVRAQIPIECGASQTTAYHDDLLGKLDVAEKSQFTFVITDVAWTTDPSNADPAAWTGWGPAADDCTSPSPALVWVGIRVTSVAAPTATSTVAAVQRDPSLP